MEAKHIYTVEHRVRYGETDQMGTFYNARALDWFEFGRTELLRALGIPYAELEEKGIFLPVVEAHINYLGKARYDDLIRITTTAELIGRVKIKFKAQIHNISADGKKIVEGYTIHAFLNSEGRPIKPPSWIAEKFGINPGT